MVTWLFLSALFFFFIFSQRFFRRWCALCCPSLRCDTTAEQLPAMEKSYRDQLLTVRGDLYGKILAASSVGQKLRYKCNVCGKNKTLFPVVFQFNVLNEKGVIFLLRDSNLLGHLRALRRYLFFGDPEFSLSLCSSLFREMATHPDMNWGPGEKCLLENTKVGSSIFKPQDLLSELEMCQIFILA